jgi:hypothetical protein
VASRRYSEHATRAAGLTPISLSSALIAAIVAVLLASAEMTATDAGMSLAEGSHGSAGAMTVLTLWETAIDYAIAGLRRISSAESSFDRIES